MKVPFEEVGEFLNYKHENISVCCQVCVVCIEDFVINANIYIICTVYAVNLPDG